MSEIIHVKAIIELFEGEGMRKTPIFSGYRPHFHFSGAPWGTDGQITLIDLEKIAPGTSGVVEVRFIKRQETEKYFRNGEQFVFKEGKQALGKGEILEVISGLSN